MGTDPDTSPGVFGFLSVFPAGLLVGLALGLPPDFTPSSVYIIVGLMVNSILSACLLVSGRRIYAVSFWSPVILIVFTLGLRGFVSKKLNAEIPNPYIELLPKGATEVRSEVIREGFDYTIYMKANLSQNGFTQFIEEVGLKQSDSERSLFMEKGEVLAWWNPRFSSDQYMLEQYSEASSGEMSSYVWGTYKNGHLFLIHVDH